ncbi:phosphate ABC transporter substrate-binding protein PstS family protein [Halomarina salina]|uniref:Phosphate ABC transporter substrate-binding protein PstS family protein n=1 Tax=Halomarina salina TaxID=1872699 RepID=A0ABD5RL54_9EURY|nr:phosphate ABC transporter substrate-binding protein PstS family protein [Halomarina salina]
MTENSSTRISRRTFIAASGTAGALALAGCTRNPNAGAGGGSAGDSAGGENGGDGTTDGGSGGSGSLSGSIDIAGSSTVFPLATAVSEEFRGEHPDVKINVSSTGSGGGFANHFCPGNTQFNNASRPIKEEEKAQCESNDVTPVELKVATDALTVVVSPENDWVDSMTVDQLKQVWSAESPPETWSDINSDWPDENLELFGPTDASGTYDYFIEAVIGEEGPGHRTDYSATEQDRTIIQGVQNSKYAIGYLGFAYYSENENSVKALGIDDGDGPVKPSLETAKSGEYAPLARPLFTYAAKESLAEEHVAEFATYFVEQSTNREVVADQVGYVPNSEEEASAQMETLQKAIDEAQGN